ncbi:GntR family transcriptional regulator, partial [Streptomyces sp. SID7499]|nr:GntR family transcriptional regulator [Streptomyces sp. SID7499]
GAGTFITRSLAQPQSGPGSPLRSALADWLDRARAEGLTGQDVTALFHAAFESAYPGEAPD